jgi:hypothetical protein
MRAFMQRSGGGVERGAWRGAEPWRPERGEAKPSHRAGRNGEHRANAARNAEHQYTMDVYPPSQTGYFGQNSQHNGALPLGRPVQGTRIQPGVIDATASRSDTYGDMPLEMLTAKFEETPGADTEYAYNDYARGLMIDRRPDDVAFEWERPRSGTNAVSAMIQFRQTGHRGEAEYGHPEMFLDFTEGDERGTTTDPDMNKFRDQSLNRGRLQRFDPDDSQNITGGGQNEAQIMEAKVRGYTDLRGRLKVFSRTLDGRTPTSMPTFEHHSARSAVEGEDPGDDRMIGTQFGQTRSPAVLIGKMIRDTAEYRTTTLDSDLKIAKYGQICKSARPTPRNPRTPMGTAAVGGESDVNQTRKVKTVLLSQMLMARANAVGDQNMEAVLRAEVQARAHAVLSADAALALAATRTEGDFAHSDQTVLMKAGAAPANTFRGINQVANHVRPSHVALEEIMQYKTLREGDHNNRREAQIDLRTDAGSSVIFSKNKDAAKTQPWLSVGDYYTTYVSRDVPKYKTVVRAAKNDGATAPIITDYLARDGRKSAIYTQGGARAGAGITGKERFDQDPWDSVYMDRSGAAPNSTGIRRDTETYVPSGPLNAI